MPVELEGGGDGSDGMKSDGHRQIKHPANQPVIPARAPQTWSEFIDAVAPECEEGDFLGVRAVEVGPDAP